MHMPWYHKLVNYRTLGVAMRAPLVYSDSRYVGLYFGTLYRVAGLAWYLQYNFL